MARFPNVDDLPGRLKPCLRSKQLPARPEACPIKEQTCRRIVPGHVNGTTRSPRDPKNLMTGKALANASGFGMRLDYR
jgi:hypothetical protein